jgi:hypothetical protein
MPTKPRPEDFLVTLFLSAFEDDTWADCKTQWLDRQQDGAVEVLATRSDGQTLAIEHTLIEFFIGEREDLERFRPFLRIEDDLSLSVPGRIIYVDVPRGVLQKGHNWNRTVDAVHDWLAANIRSLPTGVSLQTCPVDDSLADVTLQTRVILDPGFEGKPPQIRRYGPTDVGETIEKALKTKLPKLAATDATKRILLLERNQWRLDELEMHDEIEKRRDTFPALATVEVWIVETVAASPDRRRGYVEFKHYVNRESVESVAFNDGAPSSRSKRGIPRPASPRP